MAHAPHLVKGGPSVLDQVGHDMGDLHAHHSGVGHRLHVVKDVCALTPAHDDHVKVVLGIAQKVTQFSELDRTTLLDMTTDDRGHCQMFRGITCTCTTMQAPDIHDGITYIWYRSCASMHTKYQL